MSSTFSELAATALIEALGAQPESGRHLVASIHGEELEHTFRALLARSEDERSFRPGLAPPVQLRVLDNGDGCIIIPYLVQEPPPPHPRENRGGQGFVSALRDNYSDDAGPGERLMLLAFAASPNETLLTTMSQAVAESALDLARLLALALDPPPDASQALRRTLTELERLAPTHINGRLDPETVGRTAQAVIELGLLEKTEEVASELYRLPWCLGDPELFEHSGREFQNRLKDAIGYRQQLEGWANDPSTDFDSEVRKTHSSTTADKIRGARVGPTIDWARFTLADLISGGPPPPPDVETPRFAALPLAIAEATATKLLADGQTIAVQIPGPGCTITFNLTRPLTGDQSIHVVGYEGEESPFAPSVIATLTAADTNCTLLIAQLPQPRPGWSFLEAVLTKSKRITKTPLGSIRIAASIGAAEGVLVYEAHGQIELEAQAYSGDENLTFIAEQDGKQLFAETVEPPEPEFGDLITVGDDIVAPGVQSELAEVAGQDELTDSAEHLAIEAWAAGALSPGPLKTSLRERPGGIVVADVGTVSMPVTDSTAMPGSRWELERHVIEHPLTTAFRIDQSGIVHPDDRVEQLPLGELSEAFDEFLAVREQFFAELAGLRVASVLGANLTESEMADKYVETYERLLAAVPDGEPGLLGYDRLLLTDSFTTDSGELLIAPTSPLSVALHLQFQERARRWVANEPARNYFAGDAGLISAQYLVPYLRLHTTGGEWLESGYAPYPWRRYLPFSERTRHQRHPSLHRYIGRRIDRFLDVHPSYADERRTIRLAFINPGAAGHIRDALMDLVTPYLKRRGGEALQQLPAFDLKLLSDEQSSDSLLGADLDLFMGFTPEEGQPSDAAMEVMKRLSYTKGSTSEFLQDPKSFAHMAFLEGFFQPRPDLVEWNSDAHPSSMYVGGLAADIERLAKIEPGATRFLRATWTGGRTSEPTSRIAARTTEVSAAAAGVPVKSGIVRAADVLVPDWQIPQLYDCAVWVVHIDRHIGLELFAPQHAGSSAPYILDYTDQETPEPGVFDGITATSQIGPYRARIADVLGSAVDQVVPEDAAERLLRTLNLISGRWGLEMLRTADNVLRGRLATALAAQVLEQAEDLHSDPSVLTLVIALDELLRVTGGEGLSLRAGWAAKAGMKGGGSDDLLLLTVPLAEGRPQLMGRIVEVKYRSTPGSSVEDAAKQLRSTHGLLTELLASDSQPGREFQGRHLAKLILRYTSRHVAYGLRAEQPAVIGGSGALSRIAAGDYDLDLQLHRSGKVLCGDYVSVEPSLNDPSLAPQTTSAAGVDIGRIRIGRPVIASMLGAGQLPDTTTQAPESSAGTTTATPAATPDDKGGRLGRGGTAPEPDGQDGFAPEPAWDARSVPAEGATPAATPSGTGAGDQEAASVGSEPAQPAPVSSPYELPGSELREISGRLDDVLTSYNLPLQPVEPAEAVCGPNTVRFRVRMARGGTIAQVEARERDIMRELGLAKPIMVGQDAGFVTLDVPRANPVTVTFGELAPGLSRLSRTRGELPVVFGVDLAGEPRIEDLAQLPHLLVAGSTGSGKSVFLASLLASLVMLPPDELEIVLVDVKGLDFAPFSGLPHLRQAPIGNATEALEILDELYATERAHRHRTLAEAGAQSILDYFTRLGGTDLTQIVIVIDEFSNLLGGDKATGSQLEDTIQQYAEIMRSFGVYLVIATQRPSADIVTGRIKANLPARCAFRLPTHSDSMTILGRKGAEQLLGKGDMLFYRDGFIERLQAPLTTAQDVLAKSR